MNRRLLAGPGAGLLAAALFASTLLAVAAPAAAGVGDSFVNAGTRLVAGDQLISWDRAFTVTVQSDGNVVERRGTTAVWTTATTGNPGAVLDVQTDGNLVVRSAAGRALWSSGTPGHRDSALYLDDTGALTLSAGAGYWTNGVGAVVPRTVLSAGESLRSNTEDTGVLSPHGRFRLYVQLGVHLDESVPTFSAGLWDPPGPGSASEPGVLTLQTDGNLVFRARNGAVLWASRTSGAVMRLTVQDDGNAVIRRANGSAVWATGTTRVLIGPGETAASGTRFVADASTYLLGSVTTVQRDGNVVTRSQEGGLLWNTATSGNPGARLVMQTDGNLVVRRPDGRAVWQSGTRCGDRSTFNTGYGTMWVGGTRVWTTASGSAGYC